MARSTMMGWVAWMAVEKVLPLPTPYVALSAPTTVKRELGETVICLVTVELSESIYVSVTSVLTELGF